jgi:methyl-accepting chemotaxis protein
MDQINNGETFSRESIADSLEAITPLVDSSYFGLIGKLLVDLRGQSSKFLDSWTSINLWEAFNPERLIPESKKGRLVSIVDDFASIAIFFPIAWTWFTLYKASTAFQEYIVDNPTATFTFFELWQDGFGGKLAKEFMFTRYAEVSVAAILVLMGLYALRGYLISKEDLELSRSRMEFASIIANLDVLLSTERGSNPKRFEAILERAALELKDLLNSGSQLISSVHSEVEIIQKNIDAVNNASRALQETISSISAAQENQALVFSAIHSSIDRIGHEVGNMPVRIGASLNETFSAVNATLESTVLNFTNNMETNLETVKSVIETLSSVQQSYIARGDTISLRLGEILSHFPGFKGQLEMSTMAAQSDLAVASGAWKPTGVLVNAADLGEKSDG